MNHNQIRRRLATIAFGIVIAAGSVASAQAQRRLATIAFGIVIAAGSVASAQAQREPAAPFAPSSGTTSPSVYATTTVKDFLVICGNDQGGCADEVGMALDYKMVMDGTANICLPGPDYAGAALDYLNAHPETHDMPTEDGIYLALRKVYSC